MNNLNWIMGDFKTLDHCRFAILQLQSELETAEAEFASLKASTLDKMPSGSGNSNDEKLVAALARRDKLEKDLDFTRKHVADLERLLDQLDPQEREIVEQMCIKKANVGKLAESLGYDQRQIYRKRNQVLTKLAYLRFGAGYKP